MAGWFISRRQERHQKDVVCKKQKAQAIENSAVGREPSCCLQDSPAAVFRPVSAVFVDLVPPVQGGPGDISSNTPSASRATSGDCPGRPADTPDRKRSSADDNRAGVGFGMRGRRKLVVEDDNGQAERLADSSGNGDPSFGGSTGKWKGSFWP